MQLYHFNPPIIKETNTQPDPLYNPNEITRVKDILDLHKRGITVTRPVNSRSPLEDSREDMCQTFSFHCRESSFCSRINHLSSREVLLAAIIWAEPKIA